MLQLWRGAWSSISNVGAILFCKGQIEGAVPIGKGELVVEADLNALPDCYRFGDQLIGERGKSAHAYVVNDFHLEVNFHGGIS